METDRKPRKLDVAESASIDIVSLNNKVFFSFYYWHVSFNVFIS